MDDERDRSRDENDAVKLLQATLAEETATDEALSRLGESGVNKRANVEAV